MCCSWSTKGYNASGALVTIKTYFPLTLQNGKSSTHPSQLFPVGKPSSSLHGNKPNRPTSEIPRQKQRATRGEPQNFAETTTQLLLRHAEKNQAELATSLLYIVGRNKIRHCQIVRNQSLNCSEAKGLWISRIMELFNQTREPQEFCPHSLSCTLMTHNIRIDGRKFFTLICIFDVGELLTEMNRHNVKH